MEANNGTALTRAVGEGSDYLDEAVTVECQIGRETLRISSGVLAKQADGAVLVTYRNSAVLVTATTDTPWRVADFFPLTVDYRERTPAAGKFPGGFIKREGRPTTKEILTCRCIDRPIRPLFPDGFKDEVQVLCNVLSADAEYDPDVLAMIGAFASLHISCIPFQGGGGSIRVGRKDGEFLLMPTYEEREQGELDLVVSGHAEAVAMVEAGAKELSEEVMLEAIQLGHKAIQDISRIVDELRQKVGKPKLEFDAPVLPQEMIERLKSECWDELKQAVLTPGKHEMKAALKALKQRKSEEWFGHLSEDDPTRAEQMKDFGKAWGEVMSQRTRSMVLDEEVRADGRGLKDIRPIRIALGLLPQVHGSAVFTRGETQALASLTLGTQQDEQRVDGLREQFSQRFYLHYNFPPFSVGETKPIRGPGRREIGHGALAERALIPVLPDAETFPYTVRIISDILESNGSSSMATVCAGSLALMDAGVPIREPVAGIAMGLISDGQRHRVLSDILGMEDHDGDMDFKVTGTRTGVTALQMDIKIDGLPMDVMQQALQQAREGRLHILGVMGEIISSARDDLHPRAPRILRRMIPVDKIALIIGPGGRNIRAIQERTNTNLEVNDSGEVLISGSSKEALEEAARYVDSYTKDVEVGEVFEGTVVDIKDFGAFVEIAPGQEALCHVSELSDSYVEKVRDVVDVGDSLRVTVIQVDPSGKVKVSAKTNPTVRTEGRGDSRDRRPREGARREGRGPGRGGPPRGRSDRGRRDSGPSGGGEGRRDRGGEGSDSRHRRRPD